MTRLLALLILIAFAGAAHAFGLGQGNRFGWRPVANGVVTPQPTGDILLVDGVSFILQTDGASLICRAGGC